MAVKDKLNIEKLISIDITGLPTAPSVRQLLDKDVRELYIRDKSSDKIMYLKECGVIYYLGDPKSPPKQKGCTASECIKEAIVNFDLPRNYTPDVLVLKLARRYYEENITEAGVAVEILQQAIHNVSVAIKILNETLNEKIKIATSTDDITMVISLMDSINKKAGEIPNLTKKLNEAYENLLYEKNTELGRGGNTIYSSMVADNDDD